MRKGKERTKLTKDKLKQVKNELKQAEWKERRRSEKRVSRIAGKAGFNMHEKASIIITKSDMISRRKRSRSVKIKAIN